MLLDIQHQHHTACYSSNGDICSSFVLHLVNLLFCFQEHFPRANKGMEDRQRAVENNGYAKGKQQQIAY